MSQNIQQLEVELKKLPPVGSRDHSREVSRIMDRLDPSDQDLLGIQNASPDPEISYAAFILRLAIMNRTRDYAGYRDLVLAGRTKFGDKEGFPAFEALSLTRSPDPQRLRQGLEFARQALAESPENQGNRQLLARIVCDLAELDCATVQDLDEAESCILAAISEDPHYGKYYATRAHLQALQGRYGEARRSVSKAIEVEDKTGPHYSLRQSEYQDLALSITFSEKAARLEELQQAAVEKVEQTEGRLNETRTEIFTILGLLAAVIAFISTSVAIASSVSLEDAIDLQILTTGSILVIFSAFQILFGSSRYRLGVAASLVFIGAVLMFVSAT